MWPHNYKVSRLWKIGHSHKTFINIRNFILYNKAIKQNLAKDNRMLINWHNREKKAMTKYLLLSSQLRLTILRQDKNHEQNLFLASTITFIIINSTSSKRIVEWIDTLPMTYITFHHILLQKIYSINLFVFLIIWLWTYLTKVIRETCCPH